MIFTDGEAHDTLPDVVRAAEALKESGVRLIMVAEGGASPTRIPIRDSAGTLVEYKRDDDGTVIQTQRRDDVLRAVVDAAEGTLVPSAAQDQAGAVRDLVAAMKRSPSSATRTADLVPRGWIPGLIAALLLLAYTLAASGPGAHRSGRRAAVRPSRSTRSDRPPAARALAAGDPTRAAAEFLKEAGRAAPRIPRSTTRAPRRSRPGAWRWRAARSPRPRSRSTRICAIGRSTISAWSACWRRDRTARARTSCWTTRRTACGRRCCFGPRPLGPSGTWSWPSAVGRRRRRRAAAGARPRRTGGPQAPQPKPPQPQAKELSQNQAEQILNSMERRERDDPGGAAAPDAERVGRRSEGLVSAVLAVARGAGVAAGPAARSSRRRWTRTACRSARS